MTQVAPVLTLPIPFFVIFDFARDRPSLYHVYVCISTWAWSIYQIIFMCVIFRSFVHSYIHTCLPSLYPSLEREPLVACCAFGRGRLNGLLLTDDFLHVMLPVIPAHPVYERRLLPIARCSLLIAYCLRLSTGDWRLTTCRSLIEL